jgi:hypothetical protein
MSRDDLCEPGSLFLERLGRDLAVPNDDADRTDLTYGDRVVTVDEARVAVTASQRRFHSISGEGGHSTTDDAALWRGAPVFFALLSLSSLAPLSSPSFPLSQPLSLSLSLPFSSAATTQGERVVRSLRFYESQLP